MKNSFFRTSWSSLVFLVVVLVLPIILWISCGDQSITPSGPETTQETLVLNKENPQIRAVMAVQNRYTERLMTHPEVVGTATGFTEDGKPAILVFTKSDITSRSLAKGEVSEVPKSIEGIKVVVEVTGVIRPFKGKPGSGVNHRAKQTPPIQLGTSGGWKFDLANGFCCGGTLGSLVTDGTKQFILSNYHVFQGDIAPGGNGIVAQIGDPIIQPGLIDVGCNANLAQDVATLSSEPSLPGSNVDAAIAEVIPGMVDPDGKILEIGTISSSTVAAFIRQKVKKSGRTTGLTRSRVAGLNATVSVTYDTECAGVSAFTKTFTGQIIIRNKGGKFIAGGDSGSLMVEDVSVNPRAVGLLFAGSSVIAVANPIDEVLAHFGVTMVGN